MAEFVTSPSAETRESYTMAGWRQAFRALLGDGKHRSALKPRCRQRNTLNNARRGRQQGRGTVVAVLRPTLMYGI
ncbi:hypothetical protein PoMZ_05760 [Pyricularia oryzae]|uniref:Uncharacterized protein n=1 Tax=Pyricularia oryzae TaxID=318829 RepID=A0A4P7NPC5_PYROR|nr:hypothetical protein PoMZ_05760 [Pyricularia oryzae]